MSFGLKIAMPGPRWFKALFSGTEDSPHIIVTTTEDSGGNEVDFSTETTLDSVLTTMTDDTQKTQIVDDAGTIAEITVDRNLTISDNSTGLAIAKGDVTGESTIHKFGDAPDFDFGDGSVTIWDGAEDGTVWEKMVYTYSSTADIDSLSSSDNGDTQDIIVSGLDTNWAAVTQTVTLTGQTPSALSTNLIRIFRLENDGVTDNAGHVFCYVSGGTVTAGVPQVAADIRAIIQPLNNQTLMAIYTVPAGTTAYLNDWFAAIAGANKSTNYTIELRVRMFGKVFNLKHRASLSDNGSSWIQHKYEAPVRYLEKSDIEMRVSLTASGATAAGFSAGFDIVIVDN